jgi:hypothetical protein
MRGRRRVASVLGYFEWRHRCPKLKTRRALIDNLAHTYTLEAMSKKPKHSDRSIEAPSWVSLVLVCKECRRRKNGPKHLKARALASSIKSEMKTRAPQARIVLTTCLKLCPKRATSVAFIAALGTPRITAVKSRAQLRDILSVLIEQS